MVAVSRCIVSLVAVLAVVALVASAQPAAAADAGLEVAARNTTDADFAAGDRTDISVGGGAASLTTGPEPEIPIWKPGTDLSYIGFEDPSRTSISGGATEDGVGGVGDVDDDGRVEILRFNPGSGGGAGTEGGAGFTDSAGNFQGTQLLQSVGAIVDLDGDGDQQGLAVDDGELVLLDDNGGAIDTTVTGVSAELVGDTVGDPDGDGLTEIAIVQSGSLALADTGGQVQTAPVGVGKLGGASDWDDDGTVEVLSKWPDGDLQVTEADPGSWADDSPKSSFFFAASVGPIADFDGDGVEEAVSSTGGDELFLIEPDGTQEFGRLDGVVAPAIGVEEINIDGDRHEDDPGTITLTNSVDDAEAVETDLSLTDAEATVTVRDGGGTQLAQQSTTTSGTLQLDIDHSGTVQTEIELSATGPSPAASLSAHRVLFQAATPGGSGAEPTGKIATYDADISLQVNDSDFALAQGDSVTVEATNASGGTIGQTTVSSNQTVSFSYSAPLGQNSVTWTLSDSYGASATVTQQFSTPAQIRALRETDPDTTIMTDTELRFRFFTGDGQVTERSVTDGTTDLSGLPANEQFVVTVRSNTSQYTYRRITLTSIYEQSEIYLLNDSEESSRIVFELSDPTGQFPPEQTTLFVEKPIRKDHDGDGANETRYQTIAGDSFGSTASFPVILRDDERYRLRVVSDGEERILGKYTVYGATREPLQIQRVEPRSDTDSPGTVYGGVSQSDNGSVVLSIRGQVPPGGSAQYEVINETGSVIVPSTTSDSERFAHVYPLSSNASASRSLNVSYEVEDSTGATVASGSFRAGGVSGIAGRLGADPQLLSIVSWVAILATLGLVVIVDRQLAPAAGVGMATGLSVVGTVAIPAPVLGVAGVLSALVLFGGRG